ncbi:hypothetical protein AB0M22_01905 [Nocardia sp. NPDC051756]|uniref:hypothetical protein n=1 Tax=Nocardia sp. NPDC051756 TaxID=3154751 RepID=UPI0034473A01
MNPDRASELAAQQVGAAHADPDQRLTLAASCYPPQLSAYARAELTFLRWELTRGVLHPTAGSPWWRAINDRLLHDQLEAKLLGANGHASTPGARLWQRFLASPSPIAWYRAHNLSIVSGYLENQQLAEAELDVERLMINVTLARVLFTHALIECPGLALGRFARLGPRVADPRGSSVGLFLDLRNVFPRRYPLHGYSIDQLLADEGRAARAIDFGLILPKRVPVYAFAAASLAEPRITTLVEGDLFRYGGPSVDPTRLEADALTRVVAAATRARGDRRIRAARTVESRDQRPTA